MLQKTFFAGLAALILSSSANAGVIVGVLQDPVSTAGVAVSNRSGAGTWHIYAIEDAAGPADFGISSYNISLTGTTAINHRSSNGAATDANGDVQTWGFTGLRSGTNANPIVASQALPGTSPCFFTGFGQTASSANAKIIAIDAGATNITAASGGTWGAYTPNGGGTQTPAMAALETSTGHKWMFIAEGTGTIGVANVTAAVFSVYSNATGTSVATTSTVQNIGGIIPEPATMSLLGLAMVGGFGFIRRRSA